MNQKQNYQSRQIKRKERDPLQKIVTLLNTYWSIDLMNGTVEEKAWAKERLAKQIRGLSNHISPDICGDIKASLKFKEVWVRTRNSIG